MRVYKLLLALVFGVSLLVPAAVQAAGLTSDQVTAVINLLQSFNVDSHTIMTVQAVLTHQGEMGWSANASSTAGWQGMGSSTAPWPNMIPPVQIGKIMCITLNRNLGLGSEGDDVKSLQQMLAQDPTTGFTATATGFFGPLTAHAVMEFQMKNGIASSITGFVGPLTRGFFERRCGEGLGNGGQGVPGMMGALTGTISTVASSSITLQNHDGSSIVVNFTASTTIKVWTGTSTPLTSGSTSDLIAGKFAMVEGSKNSDGSITATGIVVGMPPPPPPANGGWGNGGETEHPMIPANSNSNSY